jgi:hypothetical protein
MYNSTSAMISNWSCVVVNANMTVLSSADASCHKTMICHSSKTSLTASTKPLTDAAFGLKHKMPTGVVSTGGKWVVLILVLVILRSIVSNLRLLPVLDELLLPCGAIILCAYRRTSCDRVPEASTLSSSGRRVRADIDHGCHCGINPVSLLPHYSVLHTYVIVVPLVFPPDPSIPLYCGFHI